MQQRAARGAERSTRSKRLILDAFLSFLSATSGPEGIVGTPEYLAKQDCDRRSMQAMRVKKKPQVPSAPPPMINIPPSA